MSQALRQIVVAIDFSEGSERALEFAITLARSSGAGITLVHVYPLSIDCGLPEGMATHELDCQLKRQAHNQLEELARRLGAGSIAIATALRCGRPWEKINNVAAEVGAGLIVIGRQGAGGAAFGSTTERVLRSASRPVVTIATDGGTRPLL